MAMKMYCLGFCFTPNFAEVLLVKKAKPADQAGFYNGLGGKVEGSESFVEAMAREFSEETGGVTEMHYMWQPFGALYGSSWQVECFWAMTSWQKLAAARGSEIEPVKLFRLQEIFSSLHTRRLLLPNLPGLIEFAIANYLNPGHYIQLNYDI